MASSEDLLLELAGAIVDEHDLDPGAMLKLADTLDELAFDSDEEYFDFPELVHLLSNTDVDIQEWLANDKSLDRYTSRQFNAIVKLFETRYWYNHVECLFEQLLTWQLVFGQPRQVHHQMMSRRDAEALKQLKGPSGTYTFTTALPEHYYEDFPDSYKELRETYFPICIDDAIPAFIKQYRSAHEALRNYRKRINALDKARVISRKSSLFQHSQMIMEDARDILEKTMSMAQRWHAASKKQKEYFQLPGVDLGLPYGHGITAEYEANSVNIMHIPRPDAGQPHWDAIGPVYTPVRWRCGSPWLDYFRNTRQIHSAMMHYSYSDLKKEPALAADAPGPYEVRLPQAICNIWLYYDTLYKELAVHAGRFYDTPRFPKTKEQLKKQAKSLSEDTGEPYWRVRPVKVNHGDIMMYFPVNSALTGRPRYDALGNLRFDYMSAMLEELRTGVPPEDHRDKQSIVAISAGLDANSKLADDLTGSEREVWLES